MLLIAAFCGPLFSTTHAQTPGKWRLAGNQNWIVLASRQDRDEAIAVARYFAGQHEGVRVFKASNDRFAIVVGPSNAASGPTYLPAAITLIVHVQRHLGAQSRREDFVWSASR